LQENVRYTATGPVITDTRDRRPWGFVVNVGFWLLLSYQFARWVDKNGAAWWRGQPEGKEQNAS
jgi:hypothetical protein